MGRFNRFYLIMCHWTRCETRGQWPMHSLFRRVPMVAWDSGLPSSGGKTKAAVGGDVLPLVMLLWRPAAMPFVDLNGEGHGWF